MQVLLVNGSPHAKGCTFTALSEIAAELEKQGIGSQIFQLGTQPIAGCIGCGACRKTGRCFRDDKVNEALALIPEFDGFVFGSPVYYASASGQLESFLDRLFFSGSSLFANKPGAAVVSCRRGGASAAFEQINKYFGMNNMPVVTSIYWNQVHGNTPDEVRQDAEGLQTMRQLARNMAWMLRCFEAGKAAGVPLPEKEPVIRTNFIR
ncbi:flavodoxin family protein [uncultured Mailhella sp.]|uniref:flavodoxin family protein n=1 Tax=uncultured Mailhella sp. TaxID=1981031 RepID=UPI0025FB87B0|nr:flavodoxin family protein [uncultured Mailhella sp.]